MNDTAYGVRDKRGNWTPDAIVEIAPFWSRPFNARKTLIWLIGYVWPWNTLHAMTALIWWFFVLPDTATMQNFAWGWTLSLLAVNLLANLLFYGFFEWRYYYRRVQGNSFKYHHAFPSEKPSDVFWFKSQNLDNFLRSFLVSIPLWTVIQVIFLWAFANAYVSWVGWQQHPVYLVMLMLLAPAIHEIHFFVIHRALHWGPLYRWIHSIHHNSINPSPWSSLSMHPLEGFLYHAVAWWHLLIPSNPIVALFQLHVAGFGAINGHLGFDRLKLTEKKSMRGAGYEHQLHHKYFDVNYGGSGVIPLDKWFGTWHDGSKQGEQLMQARFLRKREKRAAGTADK